VQKHLTIANSPPPCPRGLGFFSLGKIPQNTHTKLKEYCLLERERENIENMLSFGPTF